MSLNSFKTKMRDSNEVIDGTRARQKSTPPPKGSKDIRHYMEMIETVARVEYSRLPKHLIDFGEVVNIGAITLHNMFTANPERDYNITYLSTAIKWAVRNELRNRYKWYSLKQVETSEDDSQGTPDESLESDEQETQRSAVREAVYETILSVDGMMEGENPHELKDDAYTPEQVSELRELSVLVKGVIARLPERDRLVLEARFFKHMRMREIGETFGISPSRTSRVVQSALNKVKAELLKQGFVYQEV
jgi:RNA polymerase sigma factor (sigma-70 family)